MNLLELETKVIRRFPNISQSWRRPLLAAFSMVSIDVKLGSRRKYHKGRADLRHYANQPLSLMTFASVSQFHINIPWCQRQVSKYLTSNFLMPVLKLLRVTQPRTAAAYQQCSCVAARSPCHRGLATSSSTSQYVLPSLIIHQRCKNYTTFLSSQHQASSDRSSAQ